MDTSATRPLREFRDGERDSLPVALLTLNEPLVRAVQDRLAAHGLLDPPADGFLGPVSQWALAQFCQARGLEFEGKIIRDIADALLDAEPALPLRPGEDLAGKVVSAMLRRGDWVCRHPDCLTIAYVEGIDPSGAATAHRPDAFDDARLLIRVDADGGPTLAGAWEATAAPGRPAVEEPAEPIGTPRLVRGQYGAWIMGRTAIGTELEQDALVQAIPLPVTRDGSKDFRRSGDPVHHGLFVIDQHGGKDAPRDQVGGVGAGCLVGRAQAGHEAFVAYLRGDARFRASAAYRFMTALLSREELASEGPGH